ncbi:peptidoglycan DD-metalloendopeptidase family protein [Flavobacterium sp. MXW15]|uniref:Peptidoglycan DD-metalloendopeptidase family protein n=1 Tax=Xanthomonas chitinilytica TaxID=2989819 RepID=A0ABT3K0J7_9XANT|nr:peptidoglycan DD-metalloendopeptidase family protein [Xanthomonas sp. H13-6]MCW4456543.1 peptidoglycan DD-metalloendopeptidase family protein [Flavobacterium sp. MXW15]MCW4474246.1 peptidoglycan DD-metalloendopeptidase family protein [Xanthomonas sp. H13-6]
MPHSDHGRVRKQRFHERLHVLHDTVLHRKLKQHLPAAFNERWTRRHWIHASLFLTIGALAATIVPGFSNAIDSPAASAHSTLALPLPPLSLARQQEIPGDSWQVLRVESGQTLSNLFEQMNVPATVMHRVLEHPGARQALTRLRPGTEIAFDLPVDGQLRTLRFDRDPSHRIELSLHGDEIREKVLERVTTTRTVVASGEIISSLYAAGRKAGLTPSAIATMTDEIFKYDIDFSKEVQPGDRFSVVLDETWREGERIDTSKVLAATFVTGGKTYTGFRFERNGKSEYFDIDGRPLKKSFIRMPIQFARLSSSFGARRHPVLGKMRMHKGVDYAARTGTPIMAAGDARVQFAGVQRGYGNVVILDHGRGHTTLYGHMSRFGNIKTGQRVAQGTVIGYVGSTGLATGPHLHYEFRVNGVHRNPLSVTMPPPEPLKGAELVAFRAQTAPAMARIQGMEELIYANADKAPGKKATTAAAKPATAPGRG